MTTVAILHHPPVLTTNKVYYHGQHILLYQTQAEDNARYLEIFDGSIRPSSSLLLDVATEMEMYELTPNSSYFYITGIRSSKSLQLQLIPKRTLYKLFNDGIVSI